MKTLFLYATGALAAGLYLWALGVFLLTRQTMLLCGLSLVGGLVGVAFLLHAHRKKKRLLMAVALLAVVFSFSLTALSLFDTL